MQYSLDDFTIIPEPVCNIAHRADCKLEYVPIMTAPMASVISSENASTFRDAGIFTIIPRSISWESRLAMSSQGFCIAVSMDEARGLLDKCRAHDCIAEDAFKHGVLIDVANGHMVQLMQLVREIKADIDGSFLLVGNIANPKAYEIYADLGVDGVRLSVGTGSACTSSSNTGVHAGMGSLIQACRDIKKKRMFDSQLSPLIIADGGIKSYGQINKALALGADYVMLGRMLVQTEEACGKEVKKVYATPNLPALIDNAHKAKILSDYEKSKESVQRERTYYGMSTKRAQREIMEASGIGSIDEKMLKTAEGIEFTVPILYTLESFMSNFKAYLQSAMSYTNSTCLAEFIGEVEVDLMTEREFKSYYK